MNSLERFHTAQDQSDDGYAVALAELQAGCKVSHWIWYVFPQLAGLGRSSTAQFYALADLAEARAYMADPILRERLVAVTTAVDSQLAKSTSLVTLMGGDIDALKLVSSLTLFEALAAESARSGEPALAPLAEAASRILVIAAKEGFLRCAFTLMRTGQDAAAWCATSRSDSSEVVERLPQDA